MSHCVKFPLFGSFVSGRGKKTMKNYIIIALIAAFGFAATGCKNTARGIGKDTEKAGEKIQEKVN
jgi:predicted small secreted protein